jgi:hypothetical protein
MGAVSNRLIQWLSRLDAARVALTEGASTTSTRLLATGTET